LEKNINPPNLRIMFEAHTENLLFIILAGLVGDRSLQPPYVFNP